MTKTPIYNVPESIRFFSLLIEHEVYDDDDDRIAEIRVTHTDGEITTVFVENVLTMEVKQWPNDNLVPLTRTTFPNTLEGTARAHHLFHKLTGINPAHLIIDGIKPALDKLQYPEEFKELPLTNMIEVIRTIEGAELPNTKH